MMILWLALLSAILFFFFFLPPLQTSASVLAEELHKVWVFVSSGIWEVLLAFNACHLSSMHVQRVWEGPAKETLLSMLLTSHHEIDFKSWETASCGFPFRVWPQVWSPLYVALCYTESNVSPRVCHCLCIGFSAACRNVCDHENC